MRTKFLGMMAIAATLMLNQVTFADSAVCREGLGKMVQSINLDDSQKAKIKPILDQLKSDSQVAGSQMKDFDTQITQQVNSENMDQEKVNSLVDNQTKLIGDKMKARIKAQNQIFSVLNPQQKDKLKGMIKKSDEKMAALYKSCDQD